jgi:hypothetical protein
MVLYSSVRGSSKAVGAYSRVQMWRTPTWRVLGSGNRMPRLARASAKRNPVALRANWRSFDRRSFQQNSAWPNLCPSLELVFNQPPSNPNLPSHNSLRRRIHILHFQSILLHQLIWRCAFSKRIIHSYKLNRGGAMP